MPIDFENIEYLKFGNKKQQLAHDLLTKKQIFKILQEFDPILVGTIPIDIDIDNSDLDIICFSSDQNQFKNLIKSHFGAEEGFQIRESQKQGSQVVISRFFINKLEIEIFGQNIPTKEQYAYRHMIIEYKLLQQHGESFRKKIVDFKKQGYKTEPAFAKVLGLYGDPYIELLKFE